MVTFAQNCIERFSNIDKLTVGNQLLLLMLRKVKMYHCTQFLREIPGKVHVLYLEQQYEDALCKRSPYFGSK